jgi:ATP-binding cassette subfamily B protein AbcA/BmrA
MRSPKHSEEDNKKQAWRQFRSMFRGYYAVSAMSLTGSVLQVFLVFPIIYIVRKIFDTTIPSHNAVELLILGGVLLVLNLLQGGINLWSNYIVLKVTKDAIQVFRSDLLKKLFEMPRHFYTDADRGKLHSVIVRDTERVDMMISAVATVILPTLVTGAILGAVLLYLNWFLSLCLIILSPFVLWMSMTAGRNFKRETSVFQEAYARFSKGILFLLQMIDLTRVQTAEQFESEKQEKNIRDLNEVGTRLVWSNAVFRFAHDSAVVFVATVILVVGGWMVVRGRLTVGELVAFYVVIGTLRGNVSNLASTVPLIIAGRISLFEILNIMREPESKLYKGTKKLRFGGTITAEAVTFGFHNGVLFEDVNFDLSPGKIVALAGENGAGKSTIVNIILGFYAPHSGRLLAEGCPYSEIDLQHLRRSIGVVVQDSPVFPGTILENLSYGSPEAKMEMIAAAAQLATADEFIRQQPKAYDTYVGEDGLLLSGGQRQRLCIARALLRRPKLLILDQLDDHLDEKSLAQILKNLKKLDYSPACLLISHDAAVTHIADEVCVLKNGRLTTIQKTILSSPMQRSN